MPKVCPRCHFANPNRAAYCHFDGESLAKASARRPQSTWVRCIEAMASNLWRCWPRQRALAALGVAYFAWRLTRPHSPAGGAFCLVAAFACLTCLCAMARKSKVAIAVILLGYLALRVYWWMGAW